MTPVKPEMEALEEKRQEIIAKAVEAAEEVLYALVEEARVGNVAAAKLVLQVAGLFHSGNVTATQINSQVNSQFTITPEELERIVREYDAYKFEGDDYNAYND